MFQSGGGRDDSGSSGNEAPQAATVVRTESHLARFNTARALFEKMGQGDATQPRRAPITAAAKPTPAVKKPDLAARPELKVVSRLQTKLEAPGVGDGVRRSLGPGDRVRGESVSPARSSNTSSRSPSPGAPRTANGHASHHPSVSPCRPSSTSSTDSDPPRRWPPSTARSHDTTPEPLQDHELDAGLRKPPEPFSDVSEEMGPGVGQRVRPEPPAKPHGSGGAGVERRLSAHEQHKELLARHKNWFQSFSKNRTTAPSPTKGEGVPIPTSAPNTLELGPVSPTMGDSTSKTPSSPTKTEVPPPSPNKPDWRTNYTSRLDLKSPRGGDEGDSVRGRGDGDDSSRRTAGGVSSSSEQEAWSSVLQSRYGPRARQDLLANRTRGSEGETSSDWRRERAAILSGRTGQRQSGSEDEIKGHFRSTQQQPPPSGGVTCASRFEDAATLQSHWAPPHQYGQTEGDKLDTQSETSSTTTTASRENQSEGYASSRKSQSESSIASSHENQSESEEPGAKTLKDVNNVAQTERLKISRGSLAENGVRENGSRGGVLGDTCEKISGMVVAVEKKEETDLIVTESVVLKDSVKEKDIEQFKSDFTIDTAIRDSDKDLEKKTESIAKTDLSDLYSSDRRKMGKSKEKSEVVNARLKETILGETEVTDKRDYRKELEERRIRREERVERRKEEILQEGRRRRERDWSHRGVRGKYGEVRERESSEESDARRRDRSDEGRGRVRTRESSEEEGRDGSEERVRPIRRTRELRARRSEEKEAKSEEREVKSDEKEVKSEGTTPSPPTAADVVVAGVVSVLKAETVYVSSTEDLSLQEDSSKRELKLESPEGKIKEDLDIKEKEEEEKEKEEAGNVDTSRVKRQLFPDVVAECENREQDFDIRTNQVEPNETQPQEAESEAVIAPPKWPKEDPDSTPPDDSISEEASEVKREEPEKSTTPPLSPRAQSLAALDALIHGRPQEPLPTHTIPSHQESPPPQLAHSEITPAKVIQQEATPIMHAHQETTPTKLAQQEDTPTLPSLQEPTPTKLSDEVRSTSLDSTPTKPHHQEVTPPRHTHLEDDEIMYDHTVTSAQHKIQEFCTTPVTVEGFPDGRRDHSASSHDSDPEPLPPPIPPHGVDPATITTAPTPAITAHAPPDSISPNTLNNNVVACADSSPAVDNNNVMTHIDSPIPPPASPTTGPDFMTDDEAQRLLSSKESQGVLSDEEAQEVVLLLSPRSDPSIPAPCLPPPPSLTQDLEDSRYDSEPTFDSGFASETVTKYDPSAAFDPLPNYDSTPRFDPALASYDHTVEFDSAAKLDPPKYEPGSTFDPSLASPLSPEDEPSEADSSEASGDITQVTRVKEVLVEDGVHYLEDGHFWVEVPGLAEEWDDEDEDPNLPYHPHTKLTFSTKPVQVFSTYSVTEYDRKNDEVDPVAASAEYELEKRVEKMDLFPVQILKGEGGLGLSIIGMGVGADAGVEKLGIFVKTITPGGATQRDGRIQVNDQIIEVDSKSLVGVTQVFAASVLKNTSGEVNFLIGREKDPENSEVALLIKQSLQADREREERRRALGGPDYDPHTGQALFDPLSSPSEENSRSEDGHHHPHYPHYMEGAGQSPPTSPDAASPTPEVFDLEGDTDTSPENDLAGLRKRLKEVQYKHAVAEAEVVKLKMSLAEMECKMGEGLAQGQGQLQEAMSRMAELDNRLSAKSAEACTYQDMLEQSQGQFIVLEKKYYKAKKIIKEYQGRERDFLHREEYHITQLEDKDSHYNALVKALKDRVIQLEAELVKAQKKGGLPVQVPPTDPSHPTHWHPPEPHPATKLPVKEELDEAVPPHELLDVSASRAKGELAARGGLANRHLPSLKKTTSMSSASSQDHSLDDSSLDDELPEALKQHGPAEVIKQEGHQDSRRSAAGEQSLPSHLLPGSSVVSAKIAPPPSQHPPSHSQQHPPLSQPSHIPPTHPQPTQHPPSHVQQHPSHLHLPAAPSQSHSTHSQLSQSLSSHPQSTSSHTQPPQSLTSHPQLTQHHPSHSQPSQQPHSHSQSHISHVPVTQSLSGHSQSSKAPLSSHPQPSQLPPSHSQQSPLSLSHPIPSHPPPSYQQSPASHQQPPPSYSQSTQPFPTHSQPSPSPVQPYPQPPLPSYTQATMSHLSSHHPPPPPYHPPPRQPHPPRPDIPYRHPPPVARVGPVSRGEGPDSGHAPTPSLASHLASRTPQQQSLAEQLKALLAEREVESEGGGMTRVDRDVSPSKRSPTSLIEDVRQAVMQADVSSLHHHHHHHHISSSSSSSSIAHHMSTTTTTTSSAISAVSPQRAPSAFYPPAGRESLRERDGVRESGTGGSPPSPKPSRTSTTPHHPSPVAVSPNPSGVVLLSQRPLDSSSHKGTTGLGEGGGGSSGDLSSGPASLGSGDEGSGASLGGSQTSLTGPDRSRRAHMWQTAPVVDWTKEQVGQWLVVQGLEGCVNRFLEVGMTGPRLLNLDLRDLKSLHLPPDDRTRLKRKVKELRLAVEKERKQAEKEKKEREKLQKKAEKLAEKAERKKK